MVMVVGYKEGRTRVLGGDGNGSRDGGDGVGTRMVMVVGYKEGRTRVLGGDGNGSRL